MFKSSSLRVILNFFKIKNLIAPPLIKKFTNLIFSIVFNSFNLTKRETPWEKK